jgi:5'-nucleotidase (lipoprotein e(P4) family)
MTVLRRTLLTAMIALLLGCAPAPTRTPVPALPVAAPAVAEPAHDNLNATVWMQTAAEYEAIVRGTYAAALVLLDAALADPAWNALPESERSEGFESLPPAIIVDADETMIDNSPFQARGVREVLGYSRERWLAWVNERRARAMPGAVEFAQQATRRGVTVFFVTNRDAPEEAEGTVANLRALGFPIAADASNVVMRGDARAPGRDKGERRRWIGARHRVLLLLGDNLGDFLDGASVSVEARQALIAPYAGWWGSRWFMLPNPSYGSWESAIQTDCPQGRELDGRVCKYQRLRLN